MTRTYTNIWAFKLWYSCIRSQELLNTALTATELHKHFRNWIFIKYCWMKLLSGWRNIVKEYYHSRNTVQREREQLGLKPRSKSHSTTSRQIEVIVKNFFEEHDGWQDYNFRTKIVIGITNKIWPVEPNLIPHEQSQLSSYCIIQDSGSRQTRKLRDSVHQRKKNRILTVRSK